MPGAVISAGGVICIINTGAIIEWNTCFQKSCVFIEAEIVGQVYSHERDHEHVWVDLDHAIGMLSRSSEFYQLLRAPANRESRFHRSRHCYCS